MTTVNIKLDPKNKCRNAFYFLSIERCIMDVLGVDDYFNMRIYDKKIKITSNNETINATLIGLLEELDD